jgi:hypothetical protein
MPGTAMTVTVRIATSLAQDNELRFVVEVDGKRAGRSGLHRVEAATLLDNVASQMVLRRVAFTEIGLAPRYLPIAGEWRDHLLFRRLADDPA